MQGGLVNWTKEDRELVDPVLWHQFGPTHIPRGAPHPYPMLAIDAYLYTRQQGLLCQVFSQDVGICSSCCLAE